MLVILQPLWFVFVSLSVAAASYLYIGATVHQQAADPGPVVVQDSLRLGEHHLSGVVLVPSECDQLMLQTRQIALQTYLLEFTTWEEPSIACRRVPTPRSFKTTVFAPSIGIGFIATLDSQSLPLAVYQNFPAR